MLSVFGQMWPLLELSAPRRRGQVAREASRNAVLKGSPRRIAGAGGRLVSAAAPGADGVRMADRAEPP
jgi:hypothetical protein